jgi:hypothetical protein
VPSWLKTAASVPETELLLSGMLAPQNAEKIDAILFQSKGQVP